MTEEIKKTVRTRKPSTKNAEVNEVKEELVKETVVEEVVQERVLKDTDKILIMNNTTGQYGYHGTNGYAFDLAEYGQTIKIPFSELRLMASGKSRTHLTKAWIVILDEDVVEELNLTETYKHIYTPEQIDNLLRNPQALAEVFEKMVGAMQTVVVSHAKQLVKNGELHDLRVINTIKDIAKIDITE